MLPYNRIAKHVSTGNRSSFKFLLIAPCPLVEEARSAYRTESLAEFDGIVEETQETYRDLQIDMKECSDDLESGLDELASTVRF